MPKSFSELFVGTDAQVPLLNGRLQPYINLDNAAFSGRLTARAYLHIRQEHH